MRNDDTTQYGQMIRQIREDSGHSLSDAAKITAIPKSTMSRLETGDSVLSVQRFADICVAYGKDPADILARRPKGLNHSFNFEWIARAVEEIEVIISDLSKRPSPRQIGEAVAEVLKLESSRLAETPGASIDTSRYRGLIAAILD